MKSHNEGETLFGLVMSKESTMSESAYFPPDGPPRPWSIAKRWGKYYGTDILDANGESVVEIWMPYGPMSERERAYQGEDPEICDSHYESELTYQTVMLIINSVNNV